MLLQGPCVADSAILTTAGRAAQLFLLRSHLILPQVSGLGLHHL